MDVEGIVLTVLGTATFTGLLHKVYVNNTGMRGLRLRSDEIRERRRLIRQMRDQYASHVEMMQGLEPTETNLRLLDYAQGRMDRLDGLAEKKRPSWYDLEQAYANHSTYFYYISAKLDRQ